MNDGAAGNFDKDENLDEKIRDVAEALDNLTSENVDAYVEESDEDESLTLCVWVAERGGLTIQYPQIMEVIGAIALSAYERGVGDHRLASTKMPPEILN